jgi:EamA domain-containing membrane protein RarD
MRFTSKHPVVFGASRAGALAEGTLPPAREKPAAGLLFGLAAYAYWGLMPVYFKAVQEVPPGELLAHRIVWCAPLTERTRVKKSLRRWHSVRPRMRQQGRSARRGTSPLRP